ncbi:MAG: hypothetical protein WC069_04140 [Candidatus Shapirobacteria bacterium]
MKQFLGMVTIILPRSKISTVTIFSLLAPKNCQQMLLLINE